MNPSRILTMQVIRFGVLLVLYAVASDEAFSQTENSAARPDRGIVRGASYSVSDIENISLTNGNVNLSIPLASLPPIAGGKLSLGLTATYNSKLWDVVRAEEEAPGVVGCPPKLVVDTPQLSDKGGWRIGGGYFIYFRDAYEDFAYQAPRDNCDTLQEYTAVHGVRRFKAFLVTPDGAEHELRPMDNNNFYTGPRNYLRNFYRDTPDVLSQAMRYYSFDGSHLSVVIYPTNNATRWIITQNDGTQVTQYGNGIQRIKDTNGNSVKIYSDTEATHYQDEQTGREIKVIGDWAPNTTRISYQTVGGAWMNIDVQYGWITVQGKTYTVKDWSINPDEYGQPAECDRQQYNPPTGISVIRSITFPATEPGVPGKQYQFSYDADASETVTSMVRWQCHMNEEAYTRTASLGMGHLTQMVLPDGAIARYTYEYPFGSSSTVHHFEEPNDVSRGMLKLKTVEHNGVTDTWNYVIGTTGASVSNPDGTSATEFFYHQDSAFPRRDGKEGLVYRSRSSGNVLVERSWKLMPFSGANTGGSSPGSPVSFNPVVEAEYTSLLDASGNPVKMAAKTFQHDYNGNVLQTSEYDWFDPSLVTRSTEQAFVGDPYGTRVPTGVPSNVQIVRVTNNSIHNSAPTAGSANVYAKRPLASVGTPVLLNAPQETTVGGSTTRVSYDNQAYGVAPTAGNVTMVSQWDSANNLWINVDSTYDSYGNKTSTTDGRGKVTQVFYEDATHAQPTRVVVDPQNGTGQQTVITAYDYSTGAVLSQTDANGNVSTIDYTNQLLGTVDPFGRPGTTFSPAVFINNTNQRRRTTTFYEDSARRVRVEADLNAEGDGLLKSRSTGDQLGRAVLSEQSENGSTYTISSQTFYEQMGRITYTSNPRRSSGSTATDGWTRTTKDDAGRVIEVATFGGSIRPPATGTNASWTGKVTSAYLSNQTTVTDQDNKQRKSETDALGRLTKVTENPGGLNYETAYTYDALDNLKQVCQGGIVQPNGTCEGGQTRGFQYDSLKRLMSASNPESGTINYTYDPNGNLLTRTDARGTITSFSYDALNRLTTRSYAGGTAVATPSVTYAYDPAIPHGKGRLASVTTAGVSTTNYSAYDALGRVTAHNQNTNGQSYATGYAYTLAGALKSQTYPSGRVVTTAYDDSGRMSGVSGQLSGTQKTYATGFDYMAHGGVRAMQLGNGLWESAAFNTRLQMTQAGLGTSSVDTSQWKLTNDYGTTNNNGNVRSQTLIAPGLVLSETYAYDALNRLTHASETNVGNVQQWQQEFIYDRFGNRQFNINTTTAAMIKENPTISPTNNRIAGGNYAYDAAGNMTRDKNSTTLAYDAENHQTVYGEAGYAYDGDGKRVKKTWDGKTTIFVYDALGKMVAEYTNAAVQGEGGTSYLTQDQLGSTRVVTNSAGAVTSRLDYAPFGEEIAANVGGRTEAQGYVDDSVRQKFTGYERDDETGLDFAQARYYSSWQGRFTSPDKPLVDQQQSSPQSWNLYSYVRNNPLRLVDPTGELAKHVDEDGYLVGDYDGEYDEEQNAFWVEDKDAPSGGYWDTVGDDQSPVEVSCGCPPTLLDIQMEHLQNGNFGVGGGLRVVGSGARGGGGLLGRLFSWIRGGSKATASVQAVSAARFATGQLFERTIQTSKGPVGVIAEVVVQGEKLVLKDVAVYPTASSQPLTGVYRELLGARSQLLNELKSQGFKHLQIIGERVPNSTSANPGRAIDITIKIQ